MITIKHIALQNYHQDIYIYIYMHVPEYVYADGVDWKCLSQLKFTMTEKNMDFFLGHIPTYYFPIFSAYLNTAIFSIRGTKRWSSQQSMNESSMSSTVPNNGDHQCLDLCHAMSNARTSLTQCRKECLSAPLSGRLKYVNTILWIY
jgi:hypothetical protein